MIDKYISFFGEGKVEIIKTSINQPVKVWKLNEKFHRIAGPAVQAYVMNTHYFEGIKFNTEKDKLEYISNLYTLEIKKEKQLKIKLLDLK